MTTRPEVIEETFDLTQADSNITEADGTANVWSDIWKYQTPTGVAHVIRPEHTISAYLEDASAQIGNGTGQVAIEVRDSQERDSRTVFGPAPYVTVKEFTDRRKIAHFNVVETVRVRERMWIVFMVKDDGAIDASDSYFNIQIARVRSTL